MTYPTYAENIDLEVIPKDSKATVKITGSIDNLEGYDNGTFDFLF